MIATLLFVAVSWSAECADVGEMYWRAAQVRDKISLRVALDEARDNQVRKALIHVYDRPEMSPEAWKYFALGVCHGSEPGGPKDRHFRLAANGR